MNKIQKLAIVIGLVLLLIVCSYPPWKMHSKLGYPPRTLNYTFVFDPPAEMDSLRQYWEVKINLPRLLMNCAVVIIATVGLIWVFREKK